MPRARCSVNPAAAGAAAPAPATRPSPMPPAGCCGRIDLASPAPAMMTRLFGLDRGGRGSVAVRTRARTWSGVGAHAVLSCLSARQAPNSWPAATETTTSSVPFERSGGRTHRARRPLSAFPSIHRSCRIDQRTRWSSVCAYDDKEQQEDVAAVCACRIINRPGVASKSSVQRGPSTHGRGSSAIDDDDSGARTATNKRPRRLTSQTHCIGGFFSNLFVACHSFHLVKTGAVDSIVPDRSTRTPAAARSSRCVGARGYCCCSPPLLSLAPHHKRP